MRPVRTIIAVMFAAAIAVTGCAAHSTNTNPSPAPTPPVVHDVAMDFPPPTPRTPAPKPPVYRAPVLADGRYDAYIRTVDSRRNRLVVDLVQVFEGQAAVDAAMADGRSRDSAQVLYTYVRNQNPRLRTLPLARDLRLDLRGGDCAEPASHQLAKLATDARQMSGPEHTYYFTITVMSGAVQQVQEFLAINAC
jgi:hypothetical protein